MAAARTWKASLIPNTSTGLAGPTNGLLEAIDAFDVCDHPRGKRVFHQDATGRVVLEECGQCGDTVYETSDMEDGHDERRTVGSDGGGGSPDPGGE